MDEYKSSIHRRTCKKGYISIDDVTVPPGKDYIEWIAICKQKLIQREDAFMSIRSNMTAAIVAKATSTFCHKIKFNKRLTKYKVSDLILAETKHQMIAAMNQWN